MIDRLPLVIAILVILVAVLLAIRAAKRIGVAKVSSVFKRILHWVRYAYFMRFSLMLWFFAPLLCWLNTTGARAFTSGILVPEFLQGYICVAFVAVSAGFVALISARVVAINGPERWNEGLPLTLKKLLVNDKGELEWLTLLLSQVPNLYVFFYLYTNAGQEGVSQSSVSGGLAIGAALALVFWWIANAWYYLMYHSPHVRLPKVTLGKNAARTILFPRSWFWLNKARAPMAWVTIEDGAPRRLGLVATPIHNVIDYIHQTLGLEGYVRQRTELHEILPKWELYEAHVFTIGAVSMCLLLYLLIFPLAATVPALYTSVALLAFALLIVCWSLWSFRAADLRDVHGAIVWKIGLMGGTIVTWLVVVWLYVCSSAERFPTLATVLIMIIAVFWTLAGVAFFLDRYHVPVLTLVILLVLIPRLTPLVGDKEEHYFSTVSQPNSPVAQVPTPAEILESRLNSAGTENPLIIVTATGGGLHASAWTAEVLAHLEDTFAQNGKADRTPNPFRTHLLLLSTVSGGSVGLQTYLREIASAATGGDYNRDRMLTAAQCSSLEAVGWGLVYYDINKAFLPVIPYFISPSTGNGDLGGSPLLKDRTWSLRKSFARNLDNTYCEDVWKRDLLADAGQPAPFELSTLIRVTLAKNIAAEPGIDALERGLTLRSLVPAEPANQPAFTMNTTAVEDGSRFLLANYRVPQYLLDDTSGYPARSFLDTFGAGKSVMYDLPLATAAQLSATFPYVSSAARAPAAITASSDHFVDGGYYDNDGTVSAIEFLRYAITPPVDGTGPSIDQQAAKQLIAGISSKLNGSKLHILWIEIRNSGDCGDPPGDDPAWNLLDEVAAPPEALWRAGHDSVTGRNRVTLSMMQKALGANVEIVRIVMPDDHACSCSTQNSAASAAATNDPLNWSLTPNQRREVRQYAEGLANCYAAAKSWFDSDLAKWDSAPQVSAEDCKALAAAAPAKP